MVKKRINGEGIVWYVPSEKRYRAQYPVNGKRVTMLMGRGRSSSNQNLTKWLHARNSIMDWEQIPFRVRYLFYLDIYEFR